MRFRRSPMKSLLKLLFLIATSLLVNNVRAQTLTEQLVAEDPAELVKSALTKGDVVRGTILFHQGNINCAKCHRPAAEATRIGPDLSRLRPNVTAQSIVESILLPSKTITRGYETVTILTGDGILVSGMVAEEDSEKIVLRDVADIGRTIIIRRDNVEQIRPGKKDLRCRIGW